MRETAMSVADQPCKNRVGRCSAGGCWATDEAGRVMRAFKQSVRTGTRAVHVMSTTSVAAEECSQLTDSVTKVVRVWRC